jgi:hypothetical protein
MKIVRLTTTNSKCIWDNYFNENLIIKKNSKIALQNLSCELDLDNFIINAQNNTLEFNLTANDSTTIRQITLNDGVYSKNNIGTLFQDMILKLNTALGTTNFEIGKEWDVGTNKSLKVEFQCNSGTYVDMTDPKYFALVNTQITGGNLRRNAGVVGSGDANCFFKSPLGLGSSIFRVRLTSVTLATSDSGVLMGLTDTYDITRTMTHTETKYGIRYVDSTKPYRYVLNGVETISALAVAADDDVFIVWSNGLLQGRVRKSTNVVTTLFSVPYNHTDYLFPFISMYGDANCRLPVKNIKYTSSYSYNKENPVTQETDALGFPFPANRVSVQQLIFPDPDLAKFLGFTKLTDNSYIQQTTKNLLITANSQLSLADNAESYIVELETIPLEFYDGLSNQRKNYLYVFPNNESTILERINYSTNYPVFLNIKSNTDIMLKNIKARLIKEDNSAVDVIGLSSLSLLIQEDGE